MTREPLAVDSDGKLVEWEEGLPFAKSTMKVTEALLRRVIQLERDKLEMAGRLAAVEKKLDTIGMRKWD